MKTVALRNLLKRAENAGSIRIDNANGLFEKNGDAFLFLAPLRIGSEFSDRAIEIAKEQLQSGERVATKYTHRYL